MPLTPPQPCTFLQHLVCVVWLASWRLTVTTSFCRWSFPLIQPKAEINTTLKHCIQVLWRVFYSILDLEYNNTPTEIIYKISYTVNQVWAFNEPFTEVSLWRLFTLRHFFSIADQCNLIDSGIYFSFSHSLDCSLTPEIPNFGASLNTVDVENA